MLNTLIDFQTAYKLMSQPNVLAEHQDKKNPDLNYLHNLKNMIKANYSWDSNTGNPKIRFI